MLDRTSFDAFFVAVQRELDAGALDCSSETQRRYGENTMPSGDRRVRGVVFPHSTSEVQIVVQLANEHHVPLYPISAGNNIGLGSRSPVSDGQVVVDLGRHMNRILEINDELGYAVIEPGVSFQALHDELVRRGDRLMISATSGPPAGSILGNALDKGGGYGPAFDHFGSLCGLEAVLGNASVLRTGGGSLDRDESVDWHVSKYSFGPILDGLFAQSNYGIVTRAAVWLMPRPPVVESFHLLFASDEDLGPVIDLIRPLKLSGFVPTLFRVTSDVYAVATEDTSPDYRPGLGQAISSSARAALRDRHGLGAWQVSGAFYGQSREALAPSISRVRAHFEGIAGMRFVDHDEALGRAPLRVAVDSMSGRPSHDELSLLRWRPGGGITWFTPGGPMIGTRMVELDRQSRAIYTTHGMDHMVMHVASARFARSLHAIVFNREQPDECRQADACYRSLARAFAKSGIGVGRTPIDYQDYHMALLMPAFRETCAAIKTALDPNGIIAPGRYGIGAATGTSDRKAD
jgi:4-cresol dehydrogenase (hydroxylating) flavoprotein subunit